MDHAPTTSIDGRTIPSALAATDTAVRGVERTIGEDPWGARHCHVVS
jgi:hypothetical protein